MKFYTQIPLQGSYKAMELADFQRKQGWLTGLHGLLLRTKARDEQAFETLLERVRKPSMRIIYSKLDPTYFDADDLDLVFYHAMAKTWQRASIYRGVSNFDPNRDEDLTAWAWIKKIVVNSALDYRRAEIKCRRFEISEPLLNLEDPENPSRDPNQRQKQFVDPIEEVEINENIQGFVKSLTLIEQELFNHLRNGIPKKEIAHKMGLSPSRISQLISILRKKYRELY